MFTKIAVWAWVLKSWNYKTMKIQGFLIPWLLPVHFVQSRYKNIWKNVSVSTTNRTRGLDLSIPNSNKKAAWNYVRKKMNCITFLFDKIPPVFHKCTQSHQWVFWYGELVISAPGFHSNQYYPGVELFFINLAYWHIKQSANNKVTFSSFIYIYILIKA